MSRKTHPHKRAHVKRNLKPKQTHARSRGLDWRTNVLGGVIALAMLTYSSFAHWPAKGIPDLDVGTKAGAVENVSTAPPDLSGISPDAINSQPIVTRGYNAHSGGLPPGALPPGVVLPGMPMLQGGRSSDQGYGGYDGIRQQFTGKERDNESGLDYFINRYYSSTQGRFTSPDPEQAGARIDDPQSWNGYAYARNNPLMYSDPFGLDYRVCDPAGKECVTYTDKQFDKLKRGGPRDGYSFKRGNIYYNGELTATYSHDCLSCEQFVEEVAKRTAPIGIATLQFGALGTFLGVTGGTGAYYLGAGATFTTLGTLSRAGPAAGAGGTVLNQLSRGDASIFQKAAEYGLSATNSFMNNVQALTRATVESGAGRRVFEIGRLGNSPIFGSGNTLVGISELNGQTVVVKIVHGNPQILGPIP